jgi:hypothetical protein
MHHDIINDNDQMDCGNWIKFLIENRDKKGLKTGLNWIANPISLDLYGIRDMFEEEGECFGHSSESLDCIAGQKFDAIYLCRSDTWTPPHLDKYFDALRVLIMSHYDTVMMEKAVEKPREEYIKIASQISGLLKKAQEENARNRKRVK